MDSWLVFTTKVEIVGIVHGKIVNIDERIINIERTVGQRKVVENIVGIVHGIEERIDVRIEDVGKVEKIQVEKNEVEERIEVGIEERIQVEISNDDDVLRDDITERIVVVHNKKRNTNGIVLRRNCLKALLIKGIEGINYV